MPGLEDAVSFEAACVNAGCESVLGELPGGLAALVLVVTCGPAATLNALAEPSVPATALEPASFKEAPQPASPTELARMIVHIIHANLPLPDARIRCASSGRWRHVLWRHIR